MKILIAEDNAFSCALLKKTLEEVGYKVVSAGNGELAWEILQQEDAPKLALIDWMMPGLDGLDLCRKIREMDSAFPIYIILLTAKIEKEDVLKGFSSGADDIIRKPVDNDELMARIRVGRRVVEQHALLRCLVDSIPDPIYFKDNRGFYLGCNKAYSEFIGKDENDIVGRSDLDVIDADRAQSSHMNDLRVLSDGESVETEGWVVGNNGESRYHNTFKMPYLNLSDGPVGMVGISHDLTKRVHMEQEKKRLAVAVEQSAESIIIADMEGRILYVNTAFETASGFSSADVLNQTYQFFENSKQPAEFYQKLWKTISKGGMWEGRITTAKKDGSLFEHESVIYPIRDSSENVENYVVISRDITREVEIEKHLRQTQKMNAIGELAGGISHDFNNILMAILGYVALCMNNVEQESKAYKYLKEIVKAGDRATKLVQQILTFSRSEEVDSHSVFLQQVIEDSIGMVQATIRSKITVEKNIDPQCGSILGDATQIQQVMVNLLTNAVHALGKEGGRLKIGLKQVELLGRKAGAEIMELDPGLYCCITVSDTGCGMSTEIMERIFEPYYTTKEKGEGTGFGLSIVHGIVQSHRGQIVVESESGGGTSFALYLPRLIGTPEEERTAMDQSTPEGFGNILFVDDDETVLSMGCGILESFGYSIVTATDGKRGLDIFKKNNRKFDALICDCRISEMNAHELTSECLRLNPNLSIIMCSGGIEKPGNTEDVSNATFLSKPVDWRELSRIIQRQINKQIK